LASISFGDCSRDYRIFTCIEFCTSGAISVGIRLADRLRPRFAFDVLVQMGTLLAVIIYFYDDLWEITQHTLVGLWQRQPLATPSGTLGVVVGIGNHTRCGIRPAHQRPA
jgi:undecaprenyl pyrophosphate phosphatase UppP